MHISLNPSMSIVCFSTESMCGGLQIVGAGFLLRRNAFTGPQPSNQATRTIKQVECEENMCSVKRSTNDGQFKESSKMNKNTKSASNKEIKTIKSNVILLQMSRVPMAWYVLIALDMSQHIGPFFHKFPSPGTVFPMFVQIFLRLDPWCSP